MVPEKVEKVLFLIRNTSKRICHSQSRIAWFDPWYSEPSRMCKMDLIPKIVNSLQSALEFFSFSFIVPSALHDTLSHHPFNKGGKFQRNCKTGGGTEYFSLGVFSCLLEEAMGFWDHFWQGAVLPLPAMTFASIWSAMTFASIWW